MSNILMTDLLPFMSLAKKINKPPIYYYFKNIIQTYSIERKLREELCSPSLILVYQMGKVVRHFYSDREIENFKSKWSS
jgi:hypothetical protein